MGEIVDTFYQKSIQEILSKKINTKYGVVKQENQIVEQRKDIINILKTTDNPFKYLINLGLVNEGQIGHLIHRIGFRTNIADNTIPKLVDANYIEGIKDEFDFILESLPDKKSRIYNKLIMPKTQYGNRKDQLAIIGLKKIYKGSCGSDNSTPLLVTPYNFENIAGKY
jgi:hypothetical protein